MTEENKNAEKEVREGDLAADEAKQATGGSGMAIVFERSGSNLKSTKLGVNDTEMD
jgi:hypothetical protein